MRVALALCMVVVVGCTEKSTYDCAPLFEQAAPEQLGQGRHHVAGAVRDQVAALLVTRTGEVPQLVGLGVDGWLGLRAPFTDPVPSDESLGLIATVAGGFAVAWVSGRAIVLARLSLTGEQVAELGPVEVVPSGQASASVRYLFDSVEGINLVWEAPDGLHLTTFADDSRSDVPLGVGPAEAFSARFAATALAFGMVWQEGSVTLFSDGSATRVALGTPAESELQLAADGAGFALYDTHRTRPGVLGIERLDARGNTLVERAEVSFGRHFDDASWRGSSAAPFRSGTVHASMRHGTGGPLLHLTDFDNEIVDTFDMMRERGDGIEFGAMLPEFVVLEDRLVLWWYEFHSAAADRQSFIQVSAPCGVSGS